MSLYGLDVGVDDKRNLRLIEINGIESIHCTAAFEYIYGDNRVEDKIFAMLENNLPLSYLSDDYLVNKKPTIRKRLLRRFFELSGLRTRAEARERQFFQSPAALLQWLDTEPEYLSEDENVLFRRNIPPYTGQESLVLNFFNVPINVPFVNSYVAEEIARNKFLQYAVMEKNRARREYSLCTGRLEH